MADLKPLVNVAMGSITTENWANAVKPAENLQIEDTAENLQTSSFVIDIAFSDEDSL